MAVICPLSDIRSSKLRIELSAHTVEALRDFFIAAMPPARTTEEGYTVPGVLPSHSKTLATAPSCWGADGAEWGRIQ